MKPTLITLGLTALLGGCASTYGVKEDAPVKAEESVSALTLGDRSRVYSPTDAESAKPTKICSFYHNLGPQEHLTAKYSASPLTPWDVKVIAQHYFGNSLETVYAGKAVPDATYTCRGTTNKNGYFLLGDCDKEIPSGVQEKLEMKVL